MTANSLASDHTWWKGPDHLTGLEEMWLVMPLLASSSDDAERKGKYRVTLLTATKKEISWNQMKWKDARLDPERFSNWVKFLRVLTSVVCFAQNSSKIRGHVMPK